LDFGGQINNSTTIKYVPLTIGVQLMKPSDVPNVAAIPPKPKREEIEYEVVWNGGPLLPERPTRTDYWIYTEIDEDEFWKTRWRWSERPGDKRRYCRRSLFNYTGPASSPPQPMPEMEQSHDEE
jgi:hypothetical protein